MTKRKKTRKLTGELFVIMIFSAVFSLVCMLILYEARFKVYEWALRHDLVEDTRDEYIRWISQEAKKYELKPFIDLEDEDKEAAAPEYLPFLYENRDKYIGFNMYSNESGYYVIGSMPEILDDSVWSLGVWSDTDIMANQEESVEVNIGFKDITALVFIRSYRIINIIPIYMGISVILCVAAFLMPVLSFVRRRMAYMGKIRSEILVMAEGDLEHALTVKGKDEIASMAQEIDYLRQTLKENIEKERQSHQANQELIRAMSHDLRTPLTTLYGYLEILSHAKGSPEKYPEYLGRCLSKTEEIRGMSDKMFEYALVFDGQEEVEKQLLSTEVLWTEVTGQADDLETQGFCVEIEPPCLEGEISGNAFLIRRLVGNLFSNITRYGEVSVPVEIFAAQEAQRVTVVFKNAVRSDKKAIGSGVGLKSAQRIVLLHGGGLEWEEKNGFFQVTLWLPLI